MRVMFAVFSQPGHLYPFLGIAQELERLGHEVLFFCQEDATPALNRAALRGRCIWPKTAPMSKSAIRSADFSEHLKNPKWAEHCYSHVLASPVPAYIEVLRAAVRKNTPDVLATDPIFYAGPIVAAQEKHPLGVRFGDIHACFAEWFSVDYHDAMENLASDRMNLFETQGVKSDFKFGETVSPWSIRFLRQKRLLREPRPTTGILILSVRPRRRSPEEMSRSFHGSVCRRIALWCTFPLGHS